MFATVRSVLTETYESWRAHRTIRLGAGLAYYGLFAIVPLLSISLAVAGAVASDERLQESFANTIGDVVDGDATELAAAVTDSLNDVAVGSSLGVIGFASLLLTASLVFVALQDAFNTIWEVPVRTGTLASARRRLLAFGLVFLTGLVVIASVAVQAVSGIVRNLVPGETVLLDVTADVLATVGSWAVLAMTLAALFRFLAGVPILWRTALIGGVATAMALTIGTRLFALYLQRFGSTSLAGAAGTVLLGLVWFYTIAQIVLAGAELTRTLGGRLDAPVTAVTRPDRSEP